MGKWILFMSRPSRLGEVLDVVLLRTWTTKDSVCLGEQGDGELGWNVVWGLNPEWLARVV